MTRFIFIIAAAALAGCGIETASTAATAAARKKQELEQSKKTLEHAQQKIGQAMEQVQQSQQSREASGQQPLGQVRRRKKTGRILPAPCPPSKADSSSLLVTREQLDA